jgi:hypothetical protein
MSAQAVLSQKEILQQVLCSVGPGEWAFVALVTKAWRQAYLLVPAQEITGRTLSGRKSLFWCVPQCTLFSAAVVSQARMRILQKDRWRLASRHLQRAIGHWGSKTVFSSSEAYGMPLSEWVSIGALHSCNPCRVEEFVKRGCPLPVDASEVAAAFGSTSILSWLQQRGVVLSADLFDTAASNGHLHVIEYLCNRGLQCTSEAANGAARGGHLQLLKTLQSRDCPFDWTKVAWHAARGGSIEVLQYLRQNTQALFSRHTIHHAASGGHTAALAYLRSEGVPWELSACEGAAKHNHLDTLVWLCEQGCLYQHWSVMRYAAEGGSVSALAYIHQRPTEHDVGSAEYASRMSRLLNVAGTNKQLAAAQWLRAQGAAWPEFLKYQYQSKRGLRYWEGATLAWARSEGCTSPLSNTTDDGRITLS